MLERLEESKLTDVGTRFTHYTELLDAWEAGAEISKKHSTQSEHDKQRIAQLEAGIALLKIQIEVLGKFRDMRWKFYDQIDAIPKTPSTIEGGRGTPLKDR